MVKCLVKLQKDARVNEGGAAFLPRQLHVASSTLQTLFHDLTVGNVEKMSGVC